MISVLSSGYRCVVGEILEFCEKEKRASERVNERTCEAARREEKDDVATGTSVVGGSKQLDRWPRARHVLCALYFLAPTTVYVDVFYVISNLLALIWHRAQAQRR